MVKTAVGSLEEEDLIGAVRKLVLKAAPGIEEGVKWNMPSFRTCEWFLTLQSRPEKPLLLVFHLGAQRKPQAGDLRDRVADPSHLLHWRGFDRATVELEDTAALKAISRQLPRLIRAWIKCLET